MHSGPSQSGTVFIFVKNYKNICVYVYDGCSPGEKINLVFEIGFFFEPVALLPLPVQ
jgi:hypothetical protein